MRFAKKKNEEIKIINNKKERFMIKISWFIKMNFID